MKQVHEQTVLVVDSVESAGRSRPWPRRSGHAYLPQSGSLSRSTVSTRTTPMLAPAQGLVDVRE